MLGRSTDLSNSEPEEISDEDEYIEHNRSKRNKKSSRSLGGGRKPKRRRKDNSDGEEPSRDNVTTGLTVTIPKSKHGKHEDGSSRSYESQSGTNTLKLKSGVGLGLKLKLGPLGRTIPLKNSNANPLGLDSEGQRMYDALATLKLTGNVYFDDFIIHGNLIGSSSPESENVPDLSGDTEEQHDSSDAMLDILGHDERRGLLRDFLVARDLVLKESVENTYSGQKIRPITVKESREVANQLRMLILPDPTDVASSTTNACPLARLLHRKLAVEKHRRIHCIPYPFNSYPPHSQLPNTMTRLSLPEMSTSPAPGVLDALYTIRTTPYVNSFAARLSGSFILSKSGTENDNIEYRRSYIHRDWETQSPWMDLMDDVHEHHSLMHPDREQSSRLTAPIDYQALRGEHLPQVHDLLTRTFWPGIDVSDSLLHSPEQCTVVATYRRLVVGVALLSSPQETYITYLAVRAGWENSHIATKMLYSLIIRNPRKDIILHVSANNPAMLLYNRFGFKAEEFIVGFYEDYLDTHSRASKNAFRMRLRA